MSKKDQLLRLADQCEAAKKSDTQLDNAIMFAAFECNTTGGYTSSLEAAVSLIPDGFWSAFGDNLDGPFCTLDRHKDGKVVGRWIRAFAATMPLAISAAALRARAKVQEDRADTSP